MTAVPPRSNGLSAIQWTSPGEAALDVNLFTSHSEPSSVTPHEAGNSSHEQLADASPSVSPARPLFDEKSAKLVHDHLENLLKANGAMNVQAALGLMQSTSPTSTELGRALESLTPEKVAEILAESIRVGPSVSPGGAKEQVEKKTAFVDAAVSPMVAVPTAKLPLESQPKHHKLSPDVRLMNGYGLNGEERRYAQDTEGDRELIQLYKDLAEHHLLVPVSSLSDDPMMASQLSRCRLFELFEWPKGKLLVCAAHPRYEVDAFGHKTKKVLRPEIQSALNALHRHLRDFPNAAGEPASALLTGVARHYGINVSELMLAIHDKRNGSIFRVHRVFYRVPEKESSDDLFKGSKEVDHSNWQIVKTLLDTYQQSHGYDIHKGIPLSLLTPPNTMRNGNLVDILRLRFGGVLIIASIELSPPHSIVANPKMSIVPPVDAEEATAAAGTEAQALGNTDDAIRLNDSFGLSSDDFGEPSPTSTAPSAPRIVAAAAAAAATESSADPAPSQTRTALVLPELDPWCHKPYLPT